MPRGKKKNDFKMLLDKYLNIKGLDIVVFMEDGKEVELHKNRRLEKNEIVYSDRTNKELRIPLSSIQTIDFYAA